MATFSKVFSCPSEPRATGGTIRPCYSKVFSCRAAIQRRYSGISSPPSPPPGLLLPVEELKSRHGFGPWLMYADAKNDKIDLTGGGFRRCYSFLSGEIFKLPAPQLQGRRCWGTQYGWLVTFGCDGVVNLFNPLTHHHLPLPSSHTLNLPPSDIVPDDLISFFSKFSLSSNPSDSNRLVAMSMYEFLSQPAFASPGDQAWKYLNESSGTTANFDTIFYRGQFYSIGCCDITSDKPEVELKVCDITSGKPEEKTIATFAHGSNRGYTLYLVEISGHLHLIYRSFVNILHLRVTKTISFDIYRFDFQETKWISIDDLDGHALFLGNNTTFAISATDYPEIKPSCIYFTDDYSSGYARSFCDMGVYDFANKAIDVATSFCKGDNLPFSWFSRPFFFIPSL